jgi:LysR family transcriptional activator of mexEF-oprN operon
MQLMHTDYGRDLDLNLLRTFVVVAETGSVTEAASRLYLTQPAVSAALRRLTNSVGAPVLARSGRGVTLTARGQRLLNAARPHLEALVHAALAPAVFDPTTSERTVRLGMSDAAESWLLPPLVRALSASAPMLRLVGTPVQFRTVAAALAHGNVDIAISVADELPASVARKALFSGGFVCLFDPRHARLGKLTLARYLEHFHVVVSYNADLRGVVEDLLGIERKVRVAIPSFHSVGAVIDGTDLLATVPAMVAEEQRASRPHLATRRLPFELAGAAMEMLWPRATDDDDALSFVRGHVVSIAERAAQQNYGRYRTKGRGR